MRNILPFALTLLITATHAQTGFEKLYSQSGSLKLVELGNHTLLAGLSGGQGATGLSLLNAEGNIIQTTSYVQYPLLGPGAFRRYGVDNVYFATGYAAGACNGNSRMFPVVGKMDTAGGVLAYNHYESNEACKSLAIDMEVTQDKGVVTWGWQYDFFALRVDSNLTPVWSKHFGRHGHFQFIRELPGGDLLAGFNMDTAGAVVARLTAGGDFLWCKSYMRPAGMVNDCIIESDSSCIVIGVTDSPTSANQKLYMMRLNGAGDVQWCRGYSSGNPWYGELPLRLVRTSDNHYALIGISGTRPILMKTDVNGDTLWARSFGVSGYDYETGDLLASSDGGFLFTGIIGGALPDLHLGLVYVFKTDSLGFLPCTPTLPLSIAISELFPTDSSFTLTSVDGATAFPGTVSDTTFDPITVYDGCIITTIANPSLAHKVRIYPDPNSGQFTVSFTDALMAESYYSVYDTMGRLLYQRPLPKGATTEDVDLSRFGKGTYLIKVTSPEEVCYERVVVE